MTAAKPSGGTLRRYRMWAALLGSATSATHASSTVSSSALCKRQHCYVRPSLLALTGGRRRCEPLITALQALSCDAVEKRTLSLPPPSADGGEDDDAPPQPRHVALALAPPSGPVTRALRTVAQALRAGPRSTCRGRRGAAFAPKALLRALCGSCPRFRGYRQQDAQEVLRELLDALRTEEALVSPQWSPRGRVSVSVLMTAPAFPARRGRIVCAPWHGGAATGRAVPH